MRSPIGAAFAVSVMRITTRRKAVSGSVDTGVGKRKSRPRGGRD
jgi:hypothetical protein